MNSHDRAIITHTVAWVMIIAGIGCGIGCALDGAGARVTIGGILLVVCGSVAAAGLAICRVLKEQFRQLYREGVEDGRRVTRVVGVTR